MENVVAHAKEGAEAMLLTLQRDGVAHGGPHFLLGSIVVRKEEKKNPTSPDGSRGKVGNAGTL
jgi:hypothetical protein